MPVDLRQAVQRNAVEPGQLLRGGLPAVLSQTVRTLIHSRLQLGVQSYEGKYPGADVVLIEPARDDYEDFFSNIFSFSSRKGVCERAFDATRRSLLQRADHIQTVLDRYGLKLDREFLAGSRRSICGTCVGLPEFGSRGAKPKEVVLDDLRGLLDRLENYVEKAKARRDAAPRPNARRPARSRLSPGPDLPWCRGGAGPAPYTGFGHQEPSRSGFIVKLARTRDLLGQNRGGRCRIFLRSLSGSSTEGLPIAKALQSGMADFAEVTLWTQGIFEAFLRLPGVADEGARNSGFFGVGPGAWTTFTRAAAEPRRASPGTI